MTADIFAFPTMLERDDIEFERSGTSTYIRILDEAEALWSAYGKLEQAVPSDRLANFSRQVDLLESHRPEDASTMIMLGSMVELRLVPGLLMAMAAA